ncbi:phosphoesterase PA-phosphatase, partial [Candidatus Saccharibacteria bacterium]|nr:phosphoesterase PA-phosphatase [Candidatus Saccharibacteria bacterium]
MERKQKKKLVLFLVALAITVGFTAVVKFVGVEAVGPEGSSVGLATINAALHNATGFNEFFYKLTKYLGLALALPVGMFVCLGAKQLLKRKSLKKVDREYKLLAGFYALVAV